MSAQGKKLTGEEDILLHGLPNVPAVVKYAFKHASPVTSEEQLLWRLVAARAVLDCIGETGFGPSLFKKHLAAVVDAQRYFRQEWDDARMVFDFAGVEIAGIREEMILYHLDENQKVVRLPRSQSRDNRIYQVERSRPGAC